MKHHSITKPTPQRKKNWDNLFKTVPAVVAVLSLGFGVYQYCDSRDRTAKQKAKEAQEEQRRQQKELYQAASKIASEFAQETKYETAEEQKKQFWGLFGQLSVVENTPVIEAMKKFRDAITEWDRVNNPPDFFLPPSKFDKGGITFAQLADDLSQAMRASLIKT
jgi:hypothetical protein